MTQDNQNTENENETQPTVEQWRELGSAEANMWTITPPGGKAMSLSEHHAMKEKEEAEYQAHGQEVRDSFAEHAALVAKLKADGTIQ